MTDHPSGLDVAEPDGEPLHRRPADEVAGFLDVDPSSGLSADEAERRLGEHGPNKLDEPDRRSAWRRFLDQFADPLVGVLAGAAVLAGAVGDLKDAGVIAGVLLLNALLGYVQEARAENALEALEGMLALTVTVRRDGRAVDIQSEGLVPGDVVLLEAGDRVPADGRIVTASAAAADESMLTGESVPADKHAGVIEDEDVSLGDRANELFMNTTVVRGRIVMVVTRTGMETEAGRIAGMMASVVDTRTPLEDQLNVLGRRLMLVVIVAVAVVLGLALAGGTPLGEAVLEAVALGVAAIPEGLPAVVTVTLAVGVSQMAGRQAIVRRLASVETLGSTTVICTDKTGTLTRNEMTPVEVWHGGAGYALGGGSPEIPASLREAMVVAAHACDATLDDEGGHVGDPTEVAVLLAAREAGVEVDELRRRARRHGELPFDSETKLMATVPDTGRDGHLIAVKGAPDVLLERSQRIRGPDGTRDLDGDLEGDIRAALDRFAEQGRRVLAVASLRVDGEPPPTHPDDIAERLEGLTLEALVAMIDPPRDGVAEAIDVCHRAGIDVKVVTGDHPGTAGAIARQIGISGRVVTGRELDAMSDDELADAIGDIGVCSRVSPQHKVRIVDALQARDEVVAMTGDGVNDAAALRSADVGVAMGIQGTEVTKQAADMVLADDDFTTIVNAVERGRTIYDNIVTFVRFQLTTNIAAIATILAASLLALPAPFTALQILFVNLIADGPPAMALGVDRARGTVMRRAPRDRDAPILDASVVASLLPTVGVMAAATLGVLALTDPATRFTMTFTTFVLLQLTNVLAVRSGDEGVFSGYLFTNRWAWAAIGLVLAVQVAVVHVGYMQTLFETTALSPEQWLIAGGLATLPLVTTELVTRVGRARR